LKQKEAQIQAKKERISTKAKTDINKRVEAEKLVNQSRQEAISKKLAKASEKPEEVVEPLEEETNQ
jgi:hypothetical protein